MIYMLPFESSQYWKGNIKGVDMKDVEVLSDSAEVVTIVDENSYRHYLDLILGMVMIHYTMLVNI